MKSLGLILCILFTLALYTQAQVVSPSIPQIPGIRQQTFNINKANYALWWYGAVIQAIRINSSSFGGPVIPTRSIAIVAVAIHDTVNSYNPVNEYYLTPAAGPPAGSDIDAAIAGAGYQSMLRLYPNRIPDWTIIYRTQLSLLKRIRNGIRHQDIGRGFNFGRFIADGVYATRANDNAFSDNSQPFSTGGGPGNWVPNPPLFASAVGAGWGSNAPWTLLTGSQFRPPGPPFTSPDYATEYAEVFDKGIFPGLGPTTRTPLETYSGLFFAVEANGQETPPGQYLEVAYNIALDNNFNRADTARFIALTAIAQADAAITAWDAKYFYGHWRPLNAILNNTNASLPNNPNWFPLLELTPPFPEYVSGHSTFGGAVTRIWQNWFNTDNFRFRVKSDTLPGVNAIYNSFSQFASDNGFSRIYAGVHFRKSCFDGINAGIQVADWAWTHALRPL
jgi:hypothetical protein